MFRRPALPDQVIEKIQAGDEQLRNQFIAESTPEIKHWVRQFTQSFLTEQDDEFSIALAGYNQAIDRFSSKMNVPFYSYANMVVKHRLLDWIRRQKAQRRALVFSDCDDSDGQPIEEQLVDPNSGQISQNLEIEESLLQLELQLQLFGFSLSRLTERFPKHRDSQFFCIQVARQLTADPKIYAQFMGNHRLPGVELARRCQVSARTIEKNRPSIILLALLMRSDLQVIQSYISVFEREASK